MVQIEVELNYIFFESMRLSPNHLPGRGYFVGVEPNVNKTKKRLFLGIRKVEIVAVENLP